MSFPPSIIISCVEADFLQQAFITTINNLCHGCKIIWAFDRLYIEMTIIFLTWFSILWKLHRLFVPLNVRIVKTLDMPWFEWQSQIFLHLCHDSISMPVRILRSAIVSTALSVEFSIANERSKICFYLPTCNSNAMFFFLPSLLQKKDDFEIITETLLNSIIAKSNNSSSVSSSFFLYFHGVWK
jgi:hypothetical protein